MAVKKETKTVTKTRKRTTTIRKLKFVDYFMLLLSAINFAFAYHGFFIDKNDYIMSSINTLIGLTILFAVIGANIQVKIEKGETDVQIRNS